MDGLSNANPGGAFFHFLSKRLADHLEDAAFTFRGKYNTLAIWHTDVSLKVGRERVLASWVTILYSIYLS
jgi:hypothetical protein